MIHEMKKATVLFTLMAACLLCSCEKNIGTDDYKLKVNAAISEASDAHTKGELLNNDGSIKPLEDYWNSSFDVMAWKGSTQYFTSLETATYTGSTWSLGGSYIWTPGDELTFCAYANLPEGSSVSRTAAGTQTLTHTVNTTVSDQKDIILGYYSGTGEQNTTDHTITAPIKFYHPLTAVRFRVGSVGSITISSITLKGVYKQGTVTQSSSNENASAWTASQTFDFTSAPATATSDYWLLIPQDFTTGSPLKVEARDSEGHVYKASLAVKWEADHTYDYVLNYSHETGISFSVSFGQWENVSSSGIDLQQ